MNVVDPTHNAPRSVAATESLSIEPGLSVVLPALDAAGQIAATLDALEHELAGSAENLELIVVDDGSRDATVAVVEEVRTAGRPIRILRNRANLGKGMAVYLGVCFSRYSHVCFTDADLAFVPGSYARIADRARAHDRFAVASRRLRDSEILVRMEVLSYASRRHLIGVGFNLLVRMLLGLPHTDTQCGLKAFPRSLGLELLRRMRTGGFLFDIELLLAARELDLPIEEVPVCVRYNDFKSSVRLAQDSARFLASLLAIALRNRRGVYRVINPELDSDRVFELTEEVPRRTALR